MGDKMETATSSGNESGEGSASTRSQQKFQTSYQYPKLIDIAALNYMAMVMLRRPVKLSRILRYVQLSSFEDGITAGSWFREPWSSTLHL